MAIRESELTTIGSVAITDDIRTVTSQGSSTKVPASVLAKTIVENYAGSTLGGSAQTIKGAIDNSSEALTQALAVIAELSEAVEHMQLNAHPIGSYYETSDGTFNPNSAWGGTWTLETGGQVHVSSGAGYTVSGALSNTSDGGSADAIIPYHSHSVEAITSGGMSANVNHSHTIYGKYKKTCASGSSQNRVDGDGSNETSGPYRASSANLAHTHSVPAHDTNYVGTEGNTEGANMQPYIVVYRWHRIA